MHKGRGGMGNHKHGVSGHSGKGPQFMHWMKREAEKNQRKRPQIKNPKSTVRELLESIKG